MESAKIRVIYIAKMYLIILSLFNFYTNSIGVID